MPVLIAVVRIRPATVVKISKCTLHPLLKPAAPDFAARAQRKSRPRSPSHILPHTPPAAIRSAHRLLVSARQMGHASLITTPKAIPVRLPLFGRKIRMTVFITIVGVRPAVIVKIFLRANNPIAKTPALCLLQLLRWCVPAVAILAIALRSRPCGHSRCSGCAGS